MLDLYRLKYDDTKKIKVSVSRPTPTGRGMAVSLEYFSNNMKPYIKT
jgi:hypothetical protein